MKTLPVSTEFTCIDCGKVCPLTFPHWATPPYSDRWIPKRCPKCSAKRRAVMAASPLDPNWRPLGDVALDVIKGEP